MSFTITNTARRPRGLGNGPLLSITSEGAAAAIRATLSTRSVTSDLEEARATIVPSTESSVASPPPTEVYVGPDASEIDCECVAKRAGEALVNLGVMTPEDVAAFYADDLASCQADPEGFFSSVAGLFAHGDVPMCRWYELPQKRTKVLLGVAAVAAVGGGAYLLLRRRRR